MPAEYAKTRAGEATAGAPDARIVELATWLGQFWRTLKTCRLYGEHNPNALQFREHLAAQLHEHLQVHGPFTLEFAAHEVRCDGHVLVKAQSRDDDVSMPFYRDGLRTLSFNPELTAAELDTFIDLLLRVTSRTGNDSDDLVTLLWDADLPHLDMSYVSSETDVDLGDDADDPLAQMLGSQPLVLMPWPGAAPGEHLPPADGAAGTAGAGDGDAGEAAPKLDTDDTGLKLRSEDWLAGEPAHDLEERYRELDAASTAEVERFAALARRDRELGLAVATLGLVRDAVASTLRPGDEVELADLLGRALDEAVVAADIATARAIVDCLTECTEGQWDALEFVQALANPESPVTAALVKQLDACALPQVQEFGDFARSLGPMAIEWLMLIVAASAQQRTRRLLVRVLGELCEGRAERLAPWLGDPRWYVVRNAVLALTSGEGAPPVALLLPLVRHPDARVRVEVVRALANIEPDAAQPLLLELIHDPEPNIRNAALHSIGMRRHPKSSLALLELMSAPDLHKRPIEEVRPLLSALGGCAGDEALPHLESLLHAPGWFDKSAGPFRQAIARCIARIGTPAAAALLEQGAKSRTGAVRDACRLVLGGPARG